MHTYPLGWQSWSPPTPNLFRLPLWDYPPHPDSPTTLPKLTHHSKPPISLWCSWHSNGTKITEQLILSQADKFLTHKYVPKYILIDDGWCPWGDWSSPTLSKFPHALPRLTSQLKDLGYQTGLWVAPFLVDPKSNLAKSHPDWLIKNPNGTNFNGFMSYPLIKDFIPKYLLDYTNPRVMTYLLRCLDTILGDWGVTLLKLDHLYAPYFAPDLAISAQAQTVLTTIFTYIRTKYPQVYTIACGCPFDVASSRVDAIRISKDINSPQLRHLPLLSHLLYLNRRSLLSRKLELASNLPLPFGLDPDAAINIGDAEKYHKLWQSGTIQVFGLGYNL